MEYRPQSSDKRLLISEFSEATGLSRDTIRFYVRKGLLRPAVPAGASNRYQRFGQDDVERAVMIRFGQSLGFTLREIVALDAEFVRGDLSIARQAALMRERVAAVDEQIDSLRSIRRYLTRKVAWLDAGARGKEPTFTPARTARLHDRSA